MPVGFDVLREQPMSLKDLSYFFLRVATKVNFDARDVAETIFSIVLELSNYFSWRFQYGEF